MQSKITLRAMYNYDPTLFSSMVLPAGIDRNLCINRILNKSEEFEVLYSNADYVRDRIGLWSQSWQRTFEKWVAALSIKYEPLWNYDRNEIYTDTRDRKYKDKETQSSESVSNTLTSSDTKSQTEGKVSAYDETDYSDREQETGSGTTNQTGSGNAQANTSKDTGGDSNEIAQHNAHLFGNIGVTTSQQMLREELDVVTWNLYEHIADLFLEEFCILVY